MRDWLRRVTFRPYGKGSVSFTLSVYDTHNIDHYGKSILGYRLTMRSIKPPVTTLLFQGEDFCCAPSHAIDSDEMVESLMSFLTLKPGDTDPDYFKDYTAEQLHYCSEYAESLQLEVMARYPGLGE